jgi:hypothetical protein
MITKIESPAPQAYSNKLKYGIALKTAITLSGKVQLIAVVGIVEFMPTKKPFTKLKSPPNGVRRSEKMFAMFAKIYRKTLKQSKAM